MFTEITVSLKTGTDREELVKMLPNEYSQAGQEGAMKKIYLSEEQFQSSYSCVIKQQIRRHKQKTCCICRSKI